MKALQLIAASALLAACATITGKGGERRVTYACNYGPDLTITYAGSDARIQSEDGMVTLPQRPSGSGFWYESATHSLRGKGREITYLDRQMAPKQCLAK
jgi:membrane-bound inhibitor of C-type lysozyme